MIPIPLSAHPRALRWQPAFLELAHELVQVNTRPRIISRFTGLSSRRIRELYRALLGRTARSGALVQSSPRFFAIPSSWTSSSWAVQCANFIACYEDVGDASNVALNRGWQLLIAFKAYAALSVPIHVQGEKRALDINLAYALLVHAAFLESEQAELQRVRCTTCMLRYLVVRSEPRHMQHCPMCAINANQRRLSQQGFSRA